LNISSASRKRKAISPVLATVILIAITLIAAIAIAGFVFGLFGSFTSSAQISAQVTACTKAGNGTVYCTVILRNTGTSSAGVTGCNVRINGVATIGTLNPATATVTASSTKTVSCQAGTTAQTVGSQATGSFSMSNGASVPFSGVWS